MCLIDLNYAYLGFPALDTIPCTTVKDAYEEEPTIPRMHCTLFAGTLTVSGKYCFLRGWGFTSNPTLQQMSRLQRIRIHHAILIIILLIFV